MGLLERRTSEQAVLSWLASSNSVKSTNTTMKAEIHPSYGDVKVTCSCGNTFMTRSTSGEEEMHLDVCSQCHPFYTGKQKMMDTAGRVDKFRRKYGRA